MFRFVAFVGDVVGAEYARFAERVRDSAPDWRAVYSADGLVVLCRGGRPGSSEVYSLGECGGVVLGKLFESADAGGAYRHAPLAFSADESRAILRSAGRRLISHYWGRYTAFLRDPASKGAWIIRGPGGGQQCLRLRMGAAHVYVSSLEDGAPFLERAPTINWEYVAAWLCARVNGHETVLREVEQVLGGECESVRDGQSTRELYWDPIRIAEARPIESLEVAVRTVRETVRETVHAWAKCYDRILLSLSGGLDSSIVAACLKDAPSRPSVTCLNHYTEGPASDERVYAEAVARLMGFPLITVPRQAVPDLHPILQARPVATFWNLVHHAEFSGVEAGLALEHQVTAHFSGEGGDQSFYQARGIFGAGDYLRRCGPRPQWWTVAMDAARMDGESVWHVLLHAILQQIPGLAWSPRQEVGRFHTLLTPETLRSVRRSKSIVHPWLRTRSGFSGKRWQVAMLALERPCWDPLLSDHLVLPDAVSPLMAQPVMQDCLSAVTDLCIYSGWDRALARIGFMNELPKRVIARRAKGGFEEHGRRMLVGNLPFARELLEDGYLVSKGVIDRVRLATVLSGEPTFIASENLEVFDYLSVEASLRALDGLAIRQ